jgi:hypothetical protein
MDFTVHNSIGTEMKNGGEVDHTTEMSHAKHHCHLEYGCAALDCHISPPSEKVFAIVKRECLLPDSTVNQNSVKQQSRQLFQ